MDDLQLLVSINIPKSVGNINGDISQLEKLVKKLQLEVELKGLDKVAKEISSFSKLESAIKDIGKALDKVKADTKEMQTSMKKTGQDLGFKSISDELSKVSVESKGVIQDYTKLGQAIKQEMKDIGLAQESLTFKELRNSAGDLEGLTAQFKATSGEIKEFVAKANEAGRLELVNTKSTQSLERVKSDFQSLRTEIEKYRSLIGNTKANSLLDGMTNGKSIEQTTSKLREYINVAHEATNVVQALKQAEKAYDIGTINGKQYEELANNLRTGKLAVENFSNALKAAQSSQNTNNSAVKEEISLTKQRIQAMNTLRVTLNSIGKDMPKNSTALNAFKEGKTLARELADGTNKTQAEVQKLLSQYRNLIPVLKDVSSASKKETLYGDIDKSIAKIDQIKDKLRSLGADQKFDDSFVQSFKEIDNAGGKTLKALQQDFQQIKQVANEAGKELSQALKMEKFGQSVGDFEKFNSLFKSGNTEGLRQYISELAGMEAQTMKLKTVMNGAGEPIQQLAVGFKSSGQEMKSITYTIDEMTGKTGKLRQGMEELTFNANRNLSVWEQFKVAMGRFSVWSVAQEGIQATSRALREMMNEILETDKQLTDIKRVIEDGIDIDVLQNGAMNMATNLGNSFHDVLDAVGEVARAYGEFNEQQILAVANTATLMSNVSDISATEAINSLIGTMKAFNIEAQDSIRIVDSWNEVDNNFAISTEQIASAFEKSSATAQTFGVTMEENLGNITAIGGVTMETGQVIGNALKTIYSRITTLDGAKAVLKSVGVAITEIGEDGRATSRDVQDILGDLAGKWDQLSSAQKQNIGVQVAGRNQLSRFLALMNDWETSENAIQTAMNSSGGAMRENQAYLDSYEAKINKMKNVFSQLSLTIGDSFVKGGLNVGIDALTGIMGVLDTSVEKIGALGTAGALLTPLILKFTGLGSAVVAFSSKASLISGIGKVFSGLIHPVDTAKAAIQKVQLAIDNVAKKAKDLNLAKAFKDADVKMSVDSFKKYQTGLTNIQKSSETLAKGQSKLISTVKTSGGSFKVLGDKANIASKNIKFSSEAVKSASTNIGAVQKATETANKSMVGLGRAGQIAAVGMRALGTAFKTVLISTGIGIAIAAVMTGLEALINKFQEAQEKIKAQKEAQKSLIDAYRSSGDSLNDLVAKYDELYQKWGDFYQATNSGRLDQDINPEAYQEYSDVINRLSQAMPELIEYTDAQGQAHLKNADAMGKVVEKAKELSKQQAELEKTQFEAKLEEGLGSLDKSVEKYEKNIEKIKELEAALKKYQETAKSGNNAQNQYAGNGLYTSEKASAQEGVLRTQAQLNKTMQEQAQYIEDVRSKAQDLISTLKSYGNTIIEINGFSDKLGANTKAMIQDFAQANSAIVDSLNIDDYSDPTKYFEDVKAKVNEIKIANEEMATSIGKAMDAYVSSSTKGVTSIRDIESATSKAKSEFEGFAKIIPESMQSLDAVNKGTFQNLMNNSEELIKLQSKFTDGSVGYSEIRTKLEQMGLSTKDAAQFMRNLATEAGNAQIQSQLLDATTDELSSSMNSLKDSTNDTMNAFEELSGISEDNISALGSYLDVLNEANEMYGDSAEGTDAYRNAISNLSTMFGVSEDAIKNNLNSYYTMNDVLETVKENMTDADGNARSFTQAIEATGGRAAEALKLAQESGIGFNDALMMTLGLIPSFEDMASKISSIDFSNPKDQMAGLVEAYMKGETSFESFSSKMKELDSNFDETAGVYDKMKITFSSMADELLKTAEKTGDVKTAFSDMKEEMKKSLTDIGLPENVVNMMLDQLEGLTKNGIEPFKKSVEDLKKEAGEPIEVTYTANTEEANSKIDATQEKIKDADGNEIDVVAGADTTNFDEGVSKVENKVAENDGKEVNISAQLNLTSGWENNQEQLQSIVNYMKENEVNEITIQGKSYGLDELTTGLDKVKEGINSAIEVSDKMTNMDQVITDAQGNIVEIGQTIAEKMQTIGQGLSDIGDQVSKVGQIREEIANLLDPLSSLDKGLSDASTGINGALDQILDKGTTVGGQLETFKSAISTLGTDSSGSITNLQSLRDAVQNVGTAALLANASTSVLSGTLSRISGSVGSASQAVSRLTLSIATLGSLGTMLGVSFAGSMQQIASSVSATAGLTSASTAAIRSAVTTTATTVLAASTVIKLAFTMISNSATSNAGTTGGVWQTAAGRVSGAAASINSSLSSIIGTMSSVRQGAYSTTDALSRIGSAISRATSSMAGFSAIASSIVSQANRVSEAVNKAQSAKSRLASSEVSAIVGAMQEAVRQGQPQKYMEVAYQEGTLSALGEDFTSIATGAVEGISGRLVTGSASDSKIEDPYEINVWGAGQGRKYAGINKLLSQMEAKLKGITKESSKYRGTLEVIIKNERARLNLIKSELSSNEKRKKQIEAELKKLPSVNKQSEAQRKKYNALQKEYDEVIKNIDSLSTEVENLNNSINENIQEQFESFIDEIVKKYETAISKLQEKVDTYDFELEILSYVDSDNITKQLDLLKKKQQAQLAQQSHYMNLQTELQKQYNSAVKKYGANDERSLYLKEQLTEATKNYRDATLDVLDVEKEIKDIREDVADKSIDKLKDYYEKMKDIALDAIKAEQDALKKAQEEKDKLYDKEIQKIKDVYSAKLDKMDKEKSEADYQEQMQEMYSDRDELQKQIALAERDSSLAGKKRLAELQKQLAEQNKEIAKAQKERQDELLKEQLEAEQQAQIDAIEKQKEQDNEDLQNKLDSLDDQAADVEKKYDDILNDDEYWAKLKEKVMDGDLKDITDAVRDMYGNLANLGDGAFNGLIDGFSDFSEEAQKSIKELSESIIKNLQFGDGENILDILSQLASGSNGYKPSNGGGGNKQNSLGTPAWMTGNTGYSPDNILTSSGTAPNPSGSGSSGGKPVIGGTYVVKVDVGAYYTSDNARSHKNRLGTVKKGTYWIYNIYNGMINVTNQKGAMGSWINPADNKGGVDVNGKTVSGSEYVNGKIVEDKRQSSDKSTFSEGNNTLRALASNGVRPSSGGQLQAFDTGGYTGNWTGKEGKLAMLHKKELVLNEEQTKNILASVKVLDKLRSLTPKLLEPSLDGLSKANAKTQIVQEGDINVTVQVDKFTGTKQERDNLIGTLNQSIADGFKRKGKRK